MTIIKQNSFNQSLISAEQSTHQQIQVRQMQDIRLLLENLFASEEATIKLILDCVYDMGSVNLINKKFRYRPLNRVIKLIARMSKPVFRVYAWHRFKKNGPQLIANWLKSKVAFEYSINLPQPRSIEVSAIQEHQPLLADNLQREVISLRHQIRWLTGITILSLSALGIVVTTLNVNPNILIQNRPQLSSTICR